MKKKNAFKTAKNNTRGNKKRKELPTQEEEQENESLKVATQHLQTEETETDLLANLT